MVSTDAKQGPALAVIGSGYWGKNPVRNYYRLGALRIICDKNETLLAQSGEQYPGVETCLALNDVLSRKDIQGVVIATPAETHFTLARKALLAEKHVYVEKPLVLHETLEHEVFCGPSMVFTNVYNPRAHIRRMDELRNTVVKKGAILGANCTIICGHSIGRYAFVGAGAVVTRDVPDHALVVGNPARQIGWMCECGEKLDDTFQCTKCGSTFDFLATQRPTP
jgi:bifunctional N-acetylglucosamine-1-phosphate-uridyltransferase/glucosamine-1-phosphate-acetyltransferase GlmU-like protein